MTYLISLGHSLFFSMSPNLTIVQLWPVSGNGGPYARWGICDCFTIHSDREKYYQVGTLWSVFFPCVPIRCLILPFHSIRTPPALLGATSSVGFRRQASRKLIARRFGGAQRWRISTKRNLERKFCISRKSETALVIAISTSSDRVTKIWNKLLVIISVKKIWSYLFITGNKLSHVRILERQLDILINSDCQIHPHGALKSNPKIVKYWSK